MTDYHPFLYINKTTPIDAFACAQSLLAYAIDWQLEEAAQGLDRDLSWFAEMTFDVWFGLPNRNRQEAYAVGDWLDRMINL